MVLDTDIGFDVDDVWALVYLLKCPEIDLKLITTSTGDTLYRARIVAKLLELADRQDVPIGIGIPLDHTPATHAAWLDDYALRDYGGEVLRDGVGAMTDTILGSADEVTLLSIGPLPNVAAALAREADIVDNARFVGMHGSLRMGYLGATRPMREYNVKQHALSARAALSARWQKTITPLDTCGNVFLTDTRFAKVASSTDPLLAAVLANHRAWFEHIGDWPGFENIDPAVQSSILYDCVAVHLAFDESVFEIEELPVLVTEDGKTLIDIDAGTTIRCATAWQDETRFLDTLTERLTGEPV